MDAVLASYAREVTDEFIKPFERLRKTPTPVAVIEDGDVVLCFNFRTERGPWK